MRLLLDLVVAGVEFLAAELLEIVEHALMLGIKRSRKLRFHLAALHQHFQLVGGLGVILDHALGERLGVGIGLGCDELAGLDFKHVANRDFLDEIVGRDGGLRRGGPGK